MIYTEHVRDKKFQKYVSDWFSASLSKQNKMKKQIASDVKSGFRNDTQINGEIMAHFHQTAILSNSTIYHQIEYPVLADYSLLIKSMHTTFSSVLIRACSQMFLEGCKR